MTNENVTLNYDLLTDLEPGTDEFGQATLKMVMDFALQTIDEITWLATVAHQKGKVETPVVSPKALIRHIASELYDQNVRIAELWKDSFDKVFPEVVKYWLKSNEFNYITSDDGLWIDFSELEAAYDAAQAEEVGA